MAASSVSMFSKFRPLLSYCLRVNNCSRTLSFGGNDLLLNSKPISRGFSLVASPLLQSISEQSSSNKQKDDIGEVIEDGPTSLEENPYTEEAEVCLLCKANIPVSYKNPKLLSQFVSPNTGRIYGRHITRLCEMQQERITKAIIRSRKYGYMPVMYRETIFLKDPNLFDVKYTGNPDIGEHIKVPGPDATGEGRPISLSSYKRTDKPKPRRDKPKMSKAEKRRGAKGKGKA